MMQPTMVGLLTATMFLSAACHTMRPVALAELDAIRPAQVWVTRADQAVVVVSGPQVLNDRLVGFVNGRYQVMPAADVTRVLMRRPARARTAALIAAGAVSVSAMAVLVSGQGTYRNPCDRASSECDRTNP
jgi:hypothetical protein